MLIWILKATDECQEILISHSGLGQPAEINANPYEGRRQARATSAPGADLVRTFGVRILLSHNTLT